jgi:DNA-binding transcriptional MerR regulator
MVYMMTLDEAATIAGLPVAVVQYYAQLGLIGPATGYTNADICELRRARRLMDDLGLEPEAVEVVLRMRRRILALEGEVQQLRATQMAHRRALVRDMARWLEAEWNEV